MSRKREWLFQFSVRWLLVGLAILSVALAAATSPGPGWALGLAIVFNLLLPVSIIFAISSVGEQRTFWLGVAVVNLWSHLAAGKSEYLVRERQQNEVISFVDAYVATPLVKLQQSRVERRAQERVQVELAALGEFAATEMTPAAMSKANTEFIARTEREFREAVTSSLMWHSMLVGSICGGWLACWSYRRSRASAGSAH